MNDTIEYLCNLDCGMTRITEGAVKLSPEDIVPVADNLKEADAQPLGITKKNEMRCRNFSQALTI